MNKFLIVAMVTLAALVPFGLHPFFLMHVMCIAIFATAFNLLFGHTGMLSFGHAAFFGFAAYVTGYCVREFGFTPELAIIAGALSAALLGWLIGVLSIRREGIMFAMITFAFAEVVYFVCLQAPFTGGENGLQPISRGHLFGVFDLSTDRAMYFFVLAIFVACMAAIYRVTNSPFGEALRAIKENEARAVSLGYKSANYKLTAFVISAALSGVAGGTKALVFQVATLSDVQFHKSGEVVLMSLLGGAGTFIGPALGSTIVVGLHDALASIGDWVNFVLGAIFVVCVLTFREGIVGECARILGKFRNRAGSIVVPNDVQKGKFP